MTIFAATTDGLTKLISKKQKAKQELVQMRRINSAFNEGLPAFLRLGFSKADYLKFSETIRSNPEYGTAPFPARLIANKKAQIERIEKAIAINERLLHQATAC